MRGVERFGTRVASANTSANDDVVSKLKEAAPYFSLLTHVTLVLCEVLLHRGIAMAAMNESFLENF